MVGGSPLTVFIDVVGDLITRLGSRARGYGEMAGRALANTLDTSQALREAGVVRVLVCMYVCVFTPKLCAYTPNAAHLLLFYWDKFNLGFSQRELFNYLRILSATRASAPCKNSGAKVFFFGKLKRYKSN